MEQTKKAIDIDKVESAFNITFAADETE